MDREDFLETVRRQFAEQINEAYLESEHDDGNIDYESLKSMLARIGKAASFQGLQEKDYVELVHSVLPHATVEILYPEEFKKVA